MIDCIVKLTKRMFKQKLIFLYDKFLYKLTA